MSDTTTTADVAPKPAPPPNAPATDEAPARLPDDHPLVTALATQKAEIAALREKAARLDQIEEAQKTESQRQAERLAAAEKAAADAEARVMRRELALEHRLSAADAALLDTVTDENGLRALAARLAAQSTPQGNSAPLEGEPPKKPVNDPGIDFVDRLVGRAL